MKSIALLFLLNFPLMATAQMDLSVPSSPVDAVVAYVIPTDAVPDQTAGTIAGALTKETGLWIKASTWAPSNVGQPFAGTNQYPAEDYLSVGKSLAKVLPDAGPRTYFIVLTDRDINSRSQNFRFQFSLHSPMARTSVLSVARLLYDMDGRPASNEIVDARVKKMLLRIVGEMKLGWKRTSDPADLMYAPIMSVDDIDRMSVSHSIQLRGARMGAPTGS